MCLIEPRTWRGLPRLSAVLESIPDRTDVYVSTHESTGERLARVVTVAEKVASNSGVVAQAAAADDAVLKELSDVISACKSVREFLAQIEKQVIEISESATRCVDNARRQRKRCST